VSGRTAIVTLAIGPAHSGRWHHVCEENWRAYAERHDYDVICIEEPLDVSERAAARSPSWQKLLLAGQPFAADYERIVWADADVLFGEEAESIADQVPAHLVGAVDEVAMERPDVRRMLHPDPPSEYRDAGLPDGFNEMVQAGVLVLSPEHHRDVLEHVYRDYEDTGRTLYEMRPLSYELIKRDLVHWLDPRFNMLWFVFRAHNYPELARYRRHPKARAAMDRALREFDVVHFAGEAEQMEFLVDRPRKSIVVADNLPRGDTPVALFIHGRPDTTARVLDAVRKARPKQLLVTADGPREGIPGEAERCRETRALIETVDWDCQVETNYAERNLGLKDRVESGLDWVFSKVDEAIVLEDDCVPDPSFFPFCAELLERYRDDDRVMSIGGTNFQFNRPASDDSYYFSRHSLIWGWATWREAWACHDPEMTAWPELRDRGGLDEILSERLAVAYWSHFLETTYHDRDTWDRAWQLACWLRGGLHVVPNSNLVTNIGFREDAAHTRPATGGRLIGDLPTEPMGFPLRHPTEIRRQEDADRELDGVLFGGTISDMFSRLLLVRRGLAAVP
jgi:hypothetical protein